MRNACWHFAALCFFTAPVLAQSPPASQAPRSDPSAGAPTARTFATTGRYVVASAGDTIVMVDTTTGRSWWLNCIGGAEWLPIKAPADLTTPPQRADAQPAPAPPPDDRVRKLAQDLLNRYDRNNDGKLDQDEIQNTSRLRADWQQYDTNKDKRIDLDEVITYVKAVGFDSAQPRTPGDPPRAAQMTPDRAKSFIARFDRDSDGKLSPEEFPRFFGDDRFKRIDANNDGFVDVDEFVKGYAALAGTRPGQDR